jgi:hypothetical protein
MPYSISSSYLEIYQEKGKNTIIMHTTFLISATFLFIGICCTRFKC